MDATNGEMTGRMDRQREVVDLGPASAGAREMDLGLPTNLVGPQPGGVAEMSLGGVAPAFQPVQPRDQRFDRSYERPSMASSAADSAADNGRMAVSNSAAVGEFDFSHMDAAPQMSRAREMDAATAETVSDPVGRRGAEENEIRHSDVSLRNSRPARAETGRDRGATGMGRGETGSRYRDDRSTSEDGGSRYQDNSDWDRTFRRSEEK